MKKSFVFFCCLIIFAQMELVQAQQAKYPLQKLASAQPRHEIPLAMPEPPQVERPSSATPSSATPSSAAPSNPLPIALAGRSMYAHPQGTPTSAPMPETNGHIQGTEKTPLGSIPVYVPRESAVPTAPVYTSGYSIAELQQLALQYNPLLVKKQREIQAAHGIWLQAGLYKNPTLELFGDDYADDGTKGKQGFAIDQEIIRGNKLQLSQNVASWEIEIAKKEWQVAQQKVVNDVRAISYDLLATKYLILTYKDLVSIGDLSVRFSEEMVAAKESPKISMLQNRVQRNEAVIELKKAIQDENNTWNLLAAVVGNPSLEKWDIVDHLNQRGVNLNKDLVWQQILQESPEYRAEMTKLSRSRSVHARENAEKISNVTLRGEYGYHVTQEANVGGFIMSMPLKVNDRNQGNIQRSYSEILAQSREIERKELELSQRFTNLWNQYEKALESVDFYEQSILPDAKEAVDLSIEGVKHGESAPLDLFIAQQTYFKFLVSHISAHRDLAKAVTYLEGYLLEGGLSDD